MTQENIKPQCPKCGHMMGKSGKVWSGYEKRQRFKCSKCGATTIKVPDQIGLIK